MLVAESHRTRRFIVRLDKGEELCSAVRAFCSDRAVSSGELRAWGLFSGIELVPYDREAKGYTAPKRIRAFFELLQLGGTIATRDGDLVLQLHATLSSDTKDRGGGIEVVGGFLVAADVLTCELIIDSYDDVTLVREFDPALGIYALARSEPRTFAPAGSASVAPPRAPAPREPDVVRKRPVPAPSAVPAFVIPDGAPKSRVPEGGPSWADAVRLSSQLADAPERALRPGDVLEHPKFGRCEVLRVDDGEERVSVRIPAGRLVELGLEVLHLEHLRSEGTKQFYKVHAARR